MSKIEWTGITWNPTTGCSVISPGCKNCYAEVMTKRLKGMGQPKYANGFNLTVHPETLKDPFKWKKPQLVFVNSMSDLFHKDVPFDFIDQVFAVMALTPQHTYQILTKRPERMAEYFKADFRTLKDRWGKYVLRLAGGCIAWGMVTMPLPNVWLGTSVEDQKRADERIPHLLRCAAAVRFLSCEPLLGVVDLTECIHQGQLHNPLTGVGDFHPGEKLHWVIAGGESGHGSRPMHPDWVRSLRDQCAEAGVPFFFKQWGEWQEGSHVIDRKYAGEHIIMLKDGRYAPNDKPLAWAKENNVSVDEWNSLKPEVMAKVGKSKSGSLLDGVQHKEFPKTY